MAYGAVLGAQFREENKKILGYLENKSISFEIHKKFDGLVGVGGRGLSYDFYLPDHNLLIEYQGEFHDGTPVCQTNEAFLTQQEHDARKKNYAKLYGIKLLEIWYHDFYNIDSILDTLLAS